MFSQQLAKFKNIFESKGAPLVFWGPIRSLRILRIGRIGSGFICYIDYNSEELLFSHLNHVNLHCLRLAAQPDLMTVRINSTPNKNKNFYYINMQKFTLACICYAMGRIRVVG